MRQNTVHLTVTNMKKNKKEEIVEEVKEEVQEEAGCCNSEPRKEIIKLAENYAREDLNEMARKINEIIDYIS